MPEQTVVEAAGLRARFVFNGDRIEHLLEVQGPTGEYEPAYASVEGTPAEDWPASPPFQNVHIESWHEGQRIALLVGMAGRNYWSASVEATPGGGLSFDIACLVREPPRSTADGATSIESLRSTYRPLAAAAHLRLEPIGDSIFEPADSDVVAVRPVLPSDWPASVRWRYEWRRV